MTVNNQTQCRPPDEKAHYPLHVLEREGRQSIVQWIRGRWVFYRGAAPHRVTPACAAEHGWSYIGAKEMEP